MKQIKLFLIAQSALLIAVVKISLCNASLPEVSREKDNHLSKRATVPVGASVNTGTGSATPSYSGSSVHSTSQTSPSGQYGRWANGEAGRPIHPSERNEEKRKLLHSYAQSPNSPHRYEFRKPGTQPHSSSSGKGQQKKTGNRHLLLYTDQGPPKYLGDGSSTSAPAPGPQKSHKRERYDEPVLHAPPPSKGKTSTPSPAPAPGGKAKTESKRLLLDSDQGPPRHFGNGSPAPAPSPSSSKAAAGRRLLAEQGVLKKSRLRQKGGPGKRSLQSYALNGNTMIKRSHPLAPAGGNIPTAGGSGNIADLNHSSPQRFTVPGHPNERKLFYPFIPKNDSNERIVEPPPGFVRTPSSHSNAPANSPSPSPAQAHAPAPSRKSRLREKRGPKATP